MAEENKSPEEFIKGIIQESGVAKPQKDEQRISKILSQARRNAGTRDFILLIFVRFWIVLAEITCNVFARQSKGADMHPRNSKNKPDKKGNPKE